MDSNIGSMIDAAATKYGQDPATLRGIAQIETGGRNVDNAQGSGAAGVYQFIPSTWAKYGNGADPHDVAANIDAGARLTRDNRAALSKALGRDPSPGELYLAHQQGAGGATALLRNPSIAAASVVPASHILANGGDVGMTAGEFSHKWTGKLDGGGAGGSYTPPTVHYSDLMAPPANAPDAPVDKTGSNPNAGFMEQMGDLADYYSVNSLTGRAWSNFTAPGFAPDPSFKPTPDDIKQYATDPAGNRLPDEYLSRFQDAHSDAHAKWIAQRAWEEEAKTQKVESLGWGARYGIKFATMMLDPASLAVAAATDGALTPAAQALAKYGMAGNVARGALTGGVSNVAITAAMSQQGAPTTDADYLNALALGMTVGGALGPLAHTAPHAANDMVEAGHSLRDHVAATSHVDVAATVPDDARPLTVRAHDLKRPGDFVHHDTPPEAANTNGPSVKGAADFNVGAGEHPQAANQGRDFNSFDGHTPEAANESLAPNHTLTFEDFNKWHADGRLPVNENGELFTAANDPWGFPAAEPGGGGPADLGAAAVSHAVTPLELKTGEWEHVRNEGQFTSNFTVKNGTASNFVMPASGSQTAASPFVEHRLIGAHLVGNPLGFRNAANPMDAAMIMTMLREQFHGRLSRFEKPAFHEWADDAGYTRFSRMNKGPEFKRQVHDYVTGTDPGRTYHPAVQRYGNAMKGIYADIAKHLRESGLAERLPEDPNYFPRIFDPNKIEAAYRTHGADNMALLIKTAMKDMPWAESLDDARLDTLSRGYVNGIAKRALELDDDWRRAWSGDDFSHLYHVLREDASMAPDDAQAVIDTMKKWSEDPSRGSARLKHRVDLDPSTTINIPGKGSLSLHDLLHTDATHITERYIDQMSGRLGLAKMRIVDPNHMDPETGERGPKVLVNGIKSEAEFKSLIADANRSIEERYKSKATPKELENLKNWQKSGNDNLQFMFDRIMGKPMPFSKTGGGKALRVLRKYTFDRVMGATGWSHLSIFASNVGNGGFVAAMQHIPAFRHIVSQDGEWMRAHGLDQELEAVMGNHTDPLRGLQLHDWGDGDTDHKGFLGKAEHVLNQTNKLTALASGLAPIIDMNHRWAQKIIAQKFANMARKARVGADGKLSLDGISMKRMMQLGLNEDDLQKVLQSVKDHATTDRGILFNHKLTKLNLDRWDQETSFKLQGAIRRYVGRVVQENDIGSMSRWVSNPVWQMMMQFRNFPMVGTTKQLSYNLLMHDREAAQYALTAGAFGALTYIARTRVNSIGRSDRDEYLRKALDPKEIARAIGHHSGLFGLAPAFIDTGLRMAGADPLFDYRTTGGPSSLWGSAGFSTLDDASKAASALWKPWAEGRTRSQAESRALVRMIPWNNTLPATLLTNYMVGGESLHAPRIHQGH